jgi:hypothetical protein
VKVKLSVLGFGLFVKVTFQKKKKKKSENFIKQSFQL